LSHTLAKMQKTKIVICKVVTVRSLLDHLLCERIPVFNHLAFIRVPPNVTTSQQCQDSIFGNYVWHCVSKIYDLFR